MKSVSGQKTVFPKVQSFKMKWWERILFLFSKTYYGHDFGSGSDKSVTTVFKQFRGKLYLVEIKENRNDKPTD